ncbi:hypothetical protein [Natrialba sp. PRR66]|uniref:hypothetical protein n=1 Tax=Natrialba sp. PRR66 TaxID=3098146 RepID=UPI002B1E4369|nr:hypothetical protein [Natrialba sp. PRR66]
MSLVERISFGRGVVSLIGMLVVSIPILFALLLDMPPQFFADMTTTTIWFLGILSTAIIFPVLFFLLSQSGYRTYSPLHHTPRYITGTSLLFFLLSVVLVYLGYLSLVYPYHNRLFPSFKDMGAGLIITSIYSLLLVGSHTSSIISVTDVRQKESKIDEFRNYVSEFRQGSHKKSSAIEQDIIDSANSLISELDDEPIRASSQIQEELESWIRKFEQYSTTGRNKMVGESSSPEEMAEPWSQYYSQYVSITKELSDMNSSAFDKVVHARKNDR